MKLIFLLLSICGIYINTLAQINYDNADAYIQQNQQNADSKGTSFIVQMKPLALLPKEIRETSGLIYVGENQILTHNDSGGEPVLYRYDANLRKIVQKIRIANARNIDWEDITQSKDYIYIGDFGNNKGNRKDLKIYRIKKADITTTQGDISVYADSICFSFSDQTDFSESWRKSDYDCESLIHVGDSLYVFSKDWTDRKCRLYSLPDRPGTYIAKSHGGFDARGLITGAAVSPDGKKIALIGYERDPKKGSDVFIWIFTDITPYNFLLSNKERIDLGLESVLGQTEGIDFKDNNTVYISNEELEEHKVPGRLYSVRIP
ncbi:MAG: T9SS C-terminal target domain-containing protein [Bacteroidia bacterium]|nr:T9SS C-terminal target domain-containing protein [Bacteroidia bacterium]MDW8301205.1 T9SS C-terminal target domain-containing protein [Bacteroidia bacterium]